MARKLLSQARNRSAKEEAGAAFIKKRRLDLLDGEAKAQGRESACMFDAERDLPEKDNPVAKST